MIIIKTIISGFCFLTVWWLVINIKENVSFVFDPLYQLSFYFLEE